VDWTDGLSLAFTGTTMLAIVGGSLLGLVLGVLPGLGGIFGLTLFIPLTLHWSTVTALGLLVALYTSAVYGGAITAVLFRIPGHPGNIATSFEGPALTRKGRAGEAVVAIGLSGIVGGLLGVAAVVFAGPVIANYGVKISPADYFMLAVLGLSLVAASSRKQVLAGILLGGIGFLLSTVGQDQVSSETRFTFGSSYLGYNGIDFSIVAIGVFAVGSALWMLTPGEAGVTAPVPRMWTGVRAGCVTFARQIAAVLRGGVIGTVIGTIPGVGISLSNIIAYVAEERLHPKRQWGKGEMAGVVAPEAADNATLVAELIPAFTLGIPGAPASALMLYAITIHGLTPGFAFFNDNPAGAAFFITMVVSLVVFTVLGFALSGILARAALIDPRVLAPFVLVAGCVGAYAVHGSYGDIVLALVFGVVGYLLLRFRLPLTPLVLGLILGPLAESNYRRAETIAQATHANPLLSVGPVLLGVASLCVLLVTIVPAVRSRRRGQSSPIDSLSDRPEGEIRV
jgi:putative tricarboxylic transport membrane protein